MLNNSFPYPTANHPLIIICQAVFAFALFRMFFLVNRRSLPSRVSYGLLPFLVLGNLIARVQGANWFLLSNVFMFFGLAATAIVAVLEQAQLQRVLREQTATTDPIRQSIFDRIQPTFLWVIGIMTAGFVCWGYVSEYTRRGEEQKEQETAAIKENTRVTAQYNRHQQEGAKDRDSILTVISSLSAQSEAIATGVVSVSATQQTLMAGQNKLTRQVNSKDLATRRLQKDVDTTKAGVKDLQTDKSNEPLIKPVFVPSPRPEPPKKGFWRRLFGRNHDAPDSLQRVGTNGQLVRPPDERTEYTLADTIVYQ